MKARPKDWINIKRPVKIHYSFQVFIRGHWLYLSDGNSLLKFKTEAERDRVMKIARTAKTEKQLAKVLAEDGT